MDAADVGALAVELEEADENDDLELRVRGQRIPLVRRATSGSNLVVPIARAEDIMLPRCSSPARCSTLVIYSPSASQNTVGRTAIKASRGRNGIRELPREVPVALHAVADERGHGNTPVLDLGVAQEADRRLVACSARHPSCRANTAAFQNPVLRRPRKERGTLEWHTRNTEST